MKKIIKKSMKKNYKKIRFIGGFKNNTRLL